MCKKYDNVYIGQKFGNISLLSFAIAYILSRIPYAEKEALHDRKTSFC